jgi:branched-chain amino acid aminotransferase
MTSYMYYINGDFVSSEDAGLPLNDLGIVRGYGVFDLLRTYGRSPFRLPQHLERLQRSAARIDLALPKPIDEIGRIVYQTLEMNPHASDVSIRIVVTGGTSASFLMPEDHPSLIVMLAAVNPSNPAHFEEGAKLITVDHERFMPMVKSLNYITAIISLKEARKNGAVEALYRTHDGLVTECTTSNFFAFRDGRLITSDVQVLDGVTRGAALDVAEDIYEIDYRPLAYAELATVDEAFITSTTKEIMPIVRVNDIVIGDGAVGVHTRRLMSVLHELIQRETATPAPYVSMTS